MSLLNYSIVLPIFNEQDNIPLLYQRLTVVMNKITNNYEMIFVDDCSSDNSFKLLQNLHVKDSRVKILKFTKNNGHQIAVTSGLEYATGKAIIIMDADLQDPPELIPQFIKKHDEGYEIVYAQREKRDGDSIFKKLTAYLFYRIMKYLVNIDIPIDVGDFRLIDRKVANSLNSMHERNKFLRGLISWTGYKQIGIKFVRDARNSGETKYTVTKMLKLAFDGICSFSNIPLRFATILGITISFLSFLLGVWALYINYTKDVALGWTSLIISIWFIGGAQLLTMGIIGEYIGRIYDEVKMRPLYILDKKIGF